MATYIHELAGWEEAGGPHFHWDERTVAARLGPVRHRQGRLGGRMAALGFPLRDEAQLETLTQDVVKSSEIEGEILDRTQVRSSVARRLGLDAGALAPADRAVEGVVEMMLDATQNYRTPLTEARLFAWQAALFPTGRSGMAQILTGRWRDDGQGPMQVVSGPLGRQRVHFEAPAAGRLPVEMARFLGWFEGVTDHDPVLKAALAHLWFVTIHPFDDGNGRIARAIADMGLARSEDSPQRFYSLSQQIRLDRDGYYRILEATQRGDLDVTAWLLWFLDGLDRAIEGAERTLSGVLRKARLWDAIREQPLNERQRAVINRLLDGFAGDAFRGKLTTSKWAKLTKASPDTALRDITDLVKRGILRRDEGGGRSTSYSLKEGDGG